MFRVFSSRFLNRTNLLRLQSHFSYVLGICKFSPKMVHFSLALLWLYSVSKMAIFAIFQILVILRILTVFSNCFFLIEQLNVIIGFLSLLLTAFYFQFCLRDTEKKKRQKNYRWAQENGRFCFFRMCAWKNSVYFVSTCIATYSMEARISWIIVLKLRLRVFKLKHMRSCQISRTVTH